MDEEGFYVMQAYGWFHYICVRSINGRTRRNNGTTYGLSELAQIRQNSRDLRLVNFGGQNFPENEFDQDAKPLSRDELDNLDVPSADELEIWLRARY